MTTAWFLQLQGEEYTELGRALRDGRLDELPIDSAERLLLDYVKTLTLHAYRITDAQVDGLREAGWTDEQIAEATYERRCSTCSSVSPTPSTSTHRPFSTPRASPGRSRSECVGPPSCYRLITMFLNVAWASD